MQSHAFIYIQYICILVRSYTRDMIKKSICLLSGLGCALKANYCLIFTLSHVVFLSLGCTVWKISVDILIENKNKTQQL